MAAVSPIERWPYRMDNCLAASSLGSLSIRVFHIAATSPDLSAPVLQCMRSDVNVKYISLQQASRHSTATEIKRKHDREAQRETQEQLGHKNRHSQKHYLIE